MFTNQLTSYKHELYKLTMEIKHSKVLACILEDLKGDSNDSKRDLLQVVS